ncbi:MAG: flagellar biosynthetic protein FliO [Erythrobacter sp.]|uniref:flagellar biosynthetic protein FliO n=1 Tax=Erythrobacter sp. TaxID=1042 RepID=UPI0032EE0A2F
MMGEYLLRLALLLPLLGALIWGSLRLTRALQGRLLGIGGGAGRGGRALRLVETSLVAPGMRLAVVRFHDREILIGASRSGLVRLGEAQARPEFAPEGGAP